MIFYDIYLIDLVEWIINLLLLGITALVWVAAVGIAMIIYDYSGLGDLITKIYNWLFNWIAR